MFASAARQRVILQNPSVLFTARSIKHWLIKIQHKRGVVGRREERRVEEKSGRKERGVERRGE